MRHVFLLMFPLILLSAGCVAPNNYGYGSGGYGAAGYGGYPATPQYGANPGYGANGGYIAPPSPTNPYSQPAFAPFGQTIPAPATGTLGYPSQGYQPAPGATYAPSYGQSYVPPAGATSPNVWQPVTPNLNSGARNMPSQPPRALPRNIRLASNLNWGTSPGNVSSATYNSPVASSTSQPYYPPSSTLQPVAQASATADCGCDGSTASNATYVSPIQPILR